MSWRHPGRSGAALFAVLATVVGGLVTLVSRLQVERQRGRRSVADDLPDGPIIVIANHTSYADGLLLALVCRRMGRTLRLLATSGVFRAPVIGPIARRLGFIAVERGSSSAADALDHAAAALAQGEAVGLFPEGRTTRDPEHWPERAKTGMTRLALRTGAPIIPVAIVGAHRVVGRRKILSRMMINVVLRPRVQTRVGEPIDVAALVGPGGADDAEAIRSATDRIMATLIELIADVRGEVAPHPTGAVPGDGTTG